VAEETDLILTIGRWVLGEACRQARGWQAQFTDPPAVSVNVSRRQLLRSDFAAEVAAVLAETGLHPRNLKIEVSELIAMSEVDAVASTLERLFDLGVQVMIDDFGTGHLSLRHLKGFPVDTLKLDRSVVAGLGRDPESAMVAQAVIGLAHGLGLKVIAEGVERDEQLRELRAMGCEAAQGFLFSPPLAADDIDAYLRRWSCSAAHSVAAG